MTLTKSQKRRRKREAIKEKYERKIKPEICLFPEDVCPIIRSAENMCRLPFYCIKFRDEEYYVNGYCTINKTKNIVKVFYFEKARLHHIKQFKIGNPESVRAY